VRDLERHAATNDQRLDPVRVRRVFLPSHRIGKRHGRRINPSRRDQSAEQGIPDCRHEFPPRDCLRQRHLQRENICRWHSAHCGVVLRDPQRVGIVGIRDEDHAQRKILVRTAHPRGQGEEREDQKLCREFQSGGESAGRTVEFEPRFAPGACTGCGGGLSLTRNPSGP
jgi:hypothetical protein